MRSVSVERSGSPQEGRWIARPRRPRWVVQGVAGHIGLTMLSLVVPEVLSRWFGPHWTTLIVTLAFVLGWATVSASSKRVRPQDRALLDGEFGEQFPVELTIVVNDKRLGRDRGVVWFADGLMGFSGRSASYVLAPRDVRPVHSASAKRAGKDPFPSGSIVLVGAPHESYIVVSPLGKEGRRYRECLKSFIWTEERSDDERVWPPLVPYDERSALVQEAKA